MTAPFLSSDALAPLQARLAEANLAFAERYPGEAARRQPVHTVYGGAQLFRADSAVKIGGVARRALAEHASTPDAFTQMLGMPHALAERVHARVRDKLEREAVEDFRIDFEDGYGNRPDAEEDGHAESAARAVAQGLSDGTLPPFIGIRVKPVTPELHARSIRTLDIFLTSLVRATGGALPPNFVITLPKITVPAQAAFFSDVLDRLEPALGLDRGALVYEVMVETPQLIISSDGHSSLPATIEAARGRAIAAHFGTYDYTASVGVTAAEQRMRHPACGFARHVMQVALAGTGVWISDGSTAVLPVPPHRATEGGSLPDEQRRENEAVMARAWKLHYDDVTDSLRRGFYQGWDLHPAQLVTRYAAVFAFFLSGLDAAADRLRNFIEKAAQATLLGADFDDAATGQGLLNFFVRAINAGAVSEEEATQLTGLSLEELRGRSFVGILAGRR
jgi:citrate lyase beta subunit